MVTTTIRIKKRSKVRLSSFAIIGIHTMEAPETAQTAENVARYFDGVQADAHWCVDNDSRVRVIEDEYVAWTLPGANSRSRNIEIAGYARQTAADWQDAYSIAALEITALCAAEWVIEGGIPIRHLTDAQIRNGEKGFAGHVDVNRVYKKSTHWDPGPCFPWAYFLDRVRVHVALLSGKPAPAVPAPPTPSWDNRGYSQAWISQQQTKLNKLGYKLVVDGKRGTQTIAATQDFQAKHGLAVDGIPGPATSKALDAAIAAKKPTAAKPATPTRPDCTALQKAVRTNADNQWGTTTDKHFDALREASTWGGGDFPYGVDFAQRVVGATPDGVWGAKSRSAHDATVIAVQKALKAMGFDPGEIDGRWGTKTEAAYQAARRACHI